MTSNLCLWPYADTTRHLQANFKKMAKSSHILNAPINFKSDVQFIVEGQAFEAHLAIVASASPIMAAMFKSGKFQVGACVRYIP